MIDVRFCRPSLRHLDRLSHEVLSVPFFSDEATTRGILGLVDWRLGGSLSRARLRGWLTGAKDETTLMPGRPLLPFDKLLFFGLGCSDRFEETQVDAALRRMFAAWQQLHSRGAVLGLPGRSLSMVSAETAVTALVHRLQSDGLSDAFVVLEAEGEQAPLQPILERAKRKARAPML